MNNSKYNNLNFLMADNYLDEDESNEDLQFRDDILNYRGYFIENEEEEEKKFYEYGAHFPYMFLYQRLEIIQQERQKNQKELEKKLKQKEADNNKESRDDPATNEESKPNENLKDLLSIFQQKGKSRNRGDVDIGLTYMPQMNKNREEHINAIENVAVGLIKSTAGQKEEGRNKNKIIKNIKKNNMAKKNNELNGANLKYNNYTNKNEKNNIKKNSKKLTSGNQQKKIRKRNENKVWNFNNSLNGNITMSLNLLNKTKFGEKNNPKNMTHDIPYMTKITNNLVNKLKSIQYSKEKLRQQILKANAEQNLLKKAKQNKIINKFRNINSKVSYSNNYGYQNTKNTSSSKNMITNNNIKTKTKMNKIGISSNTNLINEKTDKNNKTNMKNNIIGTNLLNNNSNNNKLIKQNNFLNNLKNSNKTKNINNINKNLIKIKNNLTSKNNNNIINNSNNNNISQNNNNNKNKIPNYNYKNILLKKENIKS